MQKIKLFCFPHAGSGANAFHSWKNYIDNQLIDLCPVELPGRGKRFNEKLCQTMSKAVEDIYGQIKELINEKPYAIFGHSLGCLLAHELTHKIIKEGKANPIHIFFSGHVPNDIEEKACFSPNQFKKFVGENNLDETTLLASIHHETIDDKICFTRSDITKTKTSHPKVYRPLIIKCSPPPDATEEELVKEAIEMREANKEVFDNPELKDLVLPILRADHGICYNYQWNSKPSKLKSNITVLYGLDEEDITTSDIDHWKTHTERNCRIIPFKGGHFFIEDNLKEIAAIINRTLTNNQTKI